MAGLLRKMRRGLVRRQQRAAGSLRRDLTRGLDAADGFSPDQIQGLKLWVDPGDEATKVLSGSDYTSIKDKAQGLVFTVPGGANAPANSTHVTGDGRTVGAILFDDANTEALEVDTALAAGFEGKTSTVVTVFVPDATNNQGGIVGLFDKSAANVYVAVGYEGLVGGDPFRHQVGDGVASDDVIGPGTGSALEPFVASFRMYLGTNGIDGGGTSIPRLDGAAGTTRSGINANPTGLDRISLGRWGDSSPSTYVSGKTLLILVYDRDLTAAELAQVEDWAHRQKIHDPGVGIPAVGLVLDLNPAIASSLTITSSPDVDAIANRAGKGLASLTQATAANKPHLDSLNGHGALLFDDAASQYLEVDEAPFTESPFTLLAVVNDDDDVSGTMLTIADKDVTNHFARIGRTAGVPDRFFSQMLAGANESLEDFATGAASGTTYLLAHVEASPTSRSFYVNGNTPDTGIVSVPFANFDRTSLGRLGSSAPGAYWSGRGGRQLAYKRALSETERKSAERALATTWGVTL